MKKRILFIAPTFFGYYKEIINELENMEYEVDFFPDSPSNSNLFKAISRINKKLVKFQVNNNFKKNILPKIKNIKYDYVFFIIGMTFSYTIQNVKKIKENNPNAKFIMYQWDGEDNIKFIKKFHKYFNKIYSFDRLDCQKNNIYKFLPLFYIKNYEKVGRKKINEFEYDVSYVGTAHPQKYAFINEMSKKLNHIFQNQFIYHYMPSKLKYIFHKLTSKEYRKAKLEDFKFEKLPSEKIMEIFQKSKCIFDAPQSGQNGLTIRTIECLGAKKKLITTNKDIINYDFYNENNILIYDEEYTKNEKFFNNNYIELPKELYEKYSLYNWIKTILN